ncbi:hypothetical protein CDO28_20150 (plasmid) [Sinorhizobium meliloti]|uniref:DUF6008 family protein n=1 Tax=Rhizobium meliloti TaxID=382 RepID=UPI000B499F46|nr:DUF6008 family protein [Sinorhizobium meliloti]ASP73862.1 hypothetical protein CDO28_20150 [Sinorhizobium meliloti]MDE3858115.1 hypothetical protein [Sinorhizobium meliloti]MQW53402.1 hypothetical protein [Sinorhizobium meliloti]
MATIGISGSRPLWNLVSAAGMAAVLALLFQVGHFAEHALQFAIWLAGDLSNICGRDTPWMSPWAILMVKKLGLLVAPVAPPERQMMLGMEVLHLVGNSIFLAGLICLHICIPSKRVRWAVFIESFHLYEHVMLTATAFFLGKPIGMSTLFGATSLIESREFAVGFRVSWHFAMNLLPMPLAMMGVMEYLREDVPSSGGKRVRSASE